MITQSAESNSGTFPAETSPVLLRSLHLKNFLSFGPETPELPLGPLNLLIGANVSGISESSGQAPASVA